MDIANTLKTLQRQKTTLLLAMAVIEGIDVSPIPCIQNRLSTLDAKTVTAVDFITEQKDQLRGLAQNLSAQLTETQRRQDSQVAQFSNFDGQMAAFVPCLSDQLDQSLDNLQASLRQQLRDTLQEEMSNFIPVIEGAISSMLHSTAMSSSTEAPQTKASLDQINGHRAMERMCVNVSCEAQQNTSNPSPNRSVQALTTKDRGLNNYESSIAARSFPPNGR
ncbi:hypothetical protein FN846DRAFT_971201 [Sphaerosporella brunnea]|nr:hypothetical protein FN846DRAFT_971201 [Sphaerosporella brunnea]